MMNKYYTLLFLLLATFSCKLEKEGKTLKIVSHNMEETVGLNQVLDLNFNKAVFTDSLLIDQWLEDRNYLDFQPAIKGKYKWSSPADLSFFPTTSYAPNTTYKVSVNPSILQNSSEQYKLNERLNFEFRTQGIELINSIIYWKKIENEVVLIADLTFNRPLEEELLKEELRFEFDEQLLEYDVPNSLVNSPKVSCLLKEIPVLSERKILNIQFGKDNENLVSRSHTIEPLAVLQINSIDAEHNGSEGIISVHTSQKVEQSSIDKAFSSTGNVKFKTSVSDNGFKIYSSDLKPDNQYQIKFSKDLVGEFGGLLTEEVSEHISFGKVSPQLSFLDNKGKYLSLLGQKELGVRAVNIDEIQIEIYRVFENNLQAFYQEGKQYGWHYEWNDEEDYGEHYEYRYYNLGRFAQRIDQKYLKVNTLKGDGYNKYLSLPMLEKYAEFGGTYVVVISDKEHTYLQDSRIVSMTDLGLIVKQDKNNVYVFANSIANAKTIPGVKIDFISSNNQVIGSEVTGKDGVAVYSTKDKYKDFSINMIRASLGNDHNHLYFNDNYVDNSRFDVGGNWKNASNLDLFIYGERSLYRPGESVNLTGIVRSYDWQLPEQLPIKTRFLYPDGKVFHEGKKILNEQGAFEIKYDLSSGTPTGFYTFQVFTSNDVLLSSKSISVEEFMPDRIKVDLTLNQSDYEVGSAVVASLLAENYFGPPASNRNYQIEMTLKQGYYSAPGFSDFNFNPSTNISFYNTTDDGKTDDAGKAEKKFDISETYTGYGLLDGRVLATVFDETGRPVNQVQNFKVFTQDIFYGIGYLDYYYGVDEMVNIPLIALDKEGKELPTEAIDVKVIKKEWHTVLKKVHGKYKYVSQEKEVVVVEQMLQNNGNAQLSFVPRSSGRYEVRVFNKEADTYVSEEFYAYKYGSTSASSFEVDNEGIIDISFDKESYQTGDDVRVLMKLPFAGKVLIATEKDKVVSYHYQESDKKSLSYSFKASGDHAPNAYISATLIKPHKPGIPMTVAHGYKEFQVIPVKHEMPIEISSKLESRSKKTQTITINTLPQAELTIAVVDEGILALQNYQTPNPFTHFMAKRALEVRSYDIYPYLYPEVTATGGGAEMEQMNKRINPVDNKRVKLVSFWSGIIHADNSGKATFDIDIPQFSGALRVMAVAYKGDQFGAEDANIKVKDPVVISAAIPRFLSPGDILDLPITLTNTTSKESQAKVSLKVDGPLNVFGESNMTTSLAANQEQRLNFKLKIPEQIGAGKITFDVTALGEKFTNETEITVRPPLGLYKQSDGGSISSGSSKTIAPLADYIPSTFEGNLIVSRSPIIQFKKDLDALVGYPHGCLEQTVSKAFPQMYLSDLAKAIGADFEFTNRRNSMNNVMAAIQKIQQMQLNNGGLAYWSNARYESWWGSIYAAHFLLEAQKAGYDVPAYTLKKLMNYIRNQSRKKDTVLYYYNGNKSKTIIKKEIAYGLYVMALNGDADISTMNYYKSHATELSLDSKYLIACAFTLAGDKESARQMLPPAFEGEQSIPVSGGSFHSYTRDLAISLNALLDTDPENPQVAYLGKHVAEALKEKRYLNTQERSFGFLAMGKLAKRTNASTATATITDPNGAKIAGGGNQSWVIPLDEANRSGIKIEVEGGGEMYYFLDNEGLLASGKVKEEDNFLMARRTYYNRYKQKVSNSFNQNDLIVVELSLKSLNGKTIENVALTDLLPAGFEIENARITEVPELDWVNFDQSYDYQDIRDDRITFFTTAHGTERKFYYLARAVSKGEFVLGPVQADAMYMGEYHSYSGSGIVTVK